MTDVVSSVIHQFNTAVIPFPQKPFCIAKQETASDVAARLDAFARDIAAQYKDKDTAALIHAMYVQKQNVTMKPGLLGEGMLAAHRRSTGREEPEHHVTLDAHLEQCPLLKRIFLIHEIAVHVGQFRARAIDIRNAFGQVTLPMIDTPHYRHFTEMTAACIEKLLIDAIPAHMLDAEIESITNAGVRTLLQSLLKQWRSYSARGFMWLEHRKDFPDGQLSEREIRLFEARPEVVKFMRDTYPKSVWRSDN